PPASSPVVPAPVRRLRIAERTWWAMAAILLVLVIGILIVVWSAPKDTPPLSQNVPTPGAPEQPESPTPSPSKNGPPPDAPERPESPLPPNPGIPATGPAAAEGRGWSRTHMIIVIPLVPLVLLASWSLWWSFRAHVHLARRATSGAPEIRRVRVK